MARMFPVVDAPVVRPPRGATLLGSANPITSADRRWESGFTWRPAACSADGIVRVANYCTTAFSGFSDLATRPEMEQYVPVVLAAGLECSAISGEAALRGIADEAAALLERCGTIALAGELWTGAGGLSPASPADDLPNAYLAENAGLNRLNGGVTTSALQSMALLEEALGDCTCGGQAMIHTTGHIATLWSHLNLVERVPDGRLVTKLGTIVVADPGYTGAGPDAPSSPAGTDWAYGTGMVDVRLSEILTTPDISEAVSLSNNDFAIYALRLAAATFDPCCHVGVRVSNTVLT